MHPSRIVVATSFPPKSVRMSGGRTMEDYDRLCVESWIACGFHILSINAAEEIPPLAARYPEVEFVATERNAGALFGRRTPFIADMLAVLARADAPALGIINSDIVVEPTLAWRELVPMVASKAVVTGQRYDTRSLSGGALHRYLPGFDFFFFNRVAAEELIKDERPFSMGLPWWDYWFPVSLAMRGHHLICLVRCAVLHLAHGSQTETRSTPWRQLALEFARGVAREAAERDGSLPADWEALLALCHELDAIPAGALETGELDQHIIRLSELSVPLIAANMEAVASEAHGAEARSHQSASPSPLPAYLFANMPERIAAGNAFHQALWEESHGRIEEARQRYWAAVEGAPQDPGVLMSCASFLCERGETRLAVPMLEKAVTIAPHSAALLNNLGSALGKLRRNAEAITCFEKAVLAEPLYGLYGLSYYNLAVALYPYRHRHVVRRLEQRIAVEPDFKDGHEWRRRIGEAIERLDRGLPI